ncbi:hypothetical protein X757_07835 [Mesorhizobium sp. LSHC414A00]|nr:hypothetical protein X757_07835 [Mesorhizobium sp. LSHC414A00]
MLDGFRIVLESNSDFLENLVCRLFNRIKGRRICCQQKASRQILRKLALLVARMTFHARIPRYAFAQNHEQTLRKQDDPF